MSDIKNDNHIADERKKGGDAIERSKRVLALVDDYADKMNSDARDALRHALFDEFSATPIAPRADADTAGAKPIYQVESERIANLWTDVTCSQYANWTYSAKRIVYAATPAPSVADVAGAMTREDWKELYNIAYDRDSFERFMRTAEANIATGVSEVHIATVYEDNDGAKHVQLDVENFDNLPVGMKLYARYEK